MIKINLESCLESKEKAEKVLNSYQSKIETIHKSITNRKCAGHEMLGWLDYPFNFDKNEMSELIKLSKTWYSNKEIKNIVVLGIGGSYIGVKAAIDMCLPPFNRDKNIIFVYNLSSTYITSLIKKLEKEDFYLIVISKSGTTLETAVAFRIFYEILYNKHASASAKDRVVCITDKENGKLRHLVNKYGFKSFCIPANVGGRFSAITPVGLFAMGVMGLDVNKILEGCRKALQDTDTINLKNNTAYQYAILRHYFYSKKEKTVEVFCTYEPQMFYFSEHWKQLMGESEGKEGKALYPSNCLFTTDLHSVGQFLQQGTKCFFETVLHVKNPMLDTTIESFMNDEDGLDFINGKTVNYINRVAASSTVDAHHIDGGLDVIQLEIQKTDEYNFGYLYSWFSKAVAVSGLLLKINPFDQPGVEAYKQRMFATLRSSKKSGKNK
ncbi:glucose-6-phosphate isomerase [Malacoplasma iowae]|uniref:glucose-6-phosphate isomerase n=1 Tax=Malacoplasma iowae TaxID=2116 RepID=UPI002A18833A|nr:glucose-6-phosphate isomerase [Malacoplasma iowae]WPL38336.1 glucose-6-phosphate isomerase [Malacoplasma iowae]